ncbi:sensor histidine kinase [Lentzea tibetensis]|uniref:histidine kinase n=2 Tax=Lentzea tibetensis TaxID=2591470 RepID=A0A563ETF5_9PSEU|nr:sensor histidine kinase [Lentzea tibetensis]
MAATGAVIGAVAVTLKVADGSHPWSDTVLSGVSGSLFLLAGLVAHLRRPANRTGLLMMVVGVAFFAEDLQLSTDPAVFTAGLLFAHASTPAITHLVLAFPDGGLRSRPAKILAISTYVVVYGYALLNALVHDWTVIGRPENLLLVADHPDIARLLEDVLNVVGALIAAAVVVMLAQRFRTAPPTIRAALAPVLLIALIGGIASLAGNTVGSLHPLYPVLAPIYRIAFCAWPLAFLVGALWTRPRRAVIADLLIAARRPDSLEGLRDTLAVALRDPSLQLGRWQPDQQEFVDADGRPVGAGTVLDDRDGRPLGALSRREVPWEDARTAEAVAALAALVLDNQRLAAEAGARLAEVRASRARLVTAADDERRRVERDLHDGAQQRLVVVALGIQLARERADDPELAALLADTAEGVTAAITELRELARGIHPALLAESGLGPAIAELATRSPLPVELSVDDLPRLPATVEATAYFVVAEALTNVLKHARATAARVQLSLRGNALSVEVTDDGVGGAQVRDGSGLAGLRDRVRALDGELTVRDAAGTAVVAEIPRG